MKQITVLIILCMVSIIAFSQQTHYEANIDFENNIHLVQIDTTQILNVWQIGTPMKTFLDSAYTIPFAIITDTVNNYPINNFSSFQVKILPPPECCWGIGIVNFMHKYDFEQNKDGGFIEVKYDADTNWTNIIFDADPEIYINGYNFYSESDTISGNIPAFTGNSNGWVYSQFEWAWQIGVKSMFHDSLTIRFTMKSDSIETNQEGWLIDNIYLVLFDCTGDIDFINSNFSKLFPNPIVDISCLIFENQFNKQTMINIFDLLGKKIKTIKTTSDKVMIKRNDFNEGIYSYQIIQDNVNIRSGKFVVI